MSRKLIPKLCFLERDEIEVLLLLLSSTNRDTLLTLFDYRGCYFLQDRCCFHRPEELRSQARRVPGASLPRAGEAFLRPRCFQDRHPPGILEPDQGLQHSH